MSSRSGWKKADGQRLGPLLGLLCGPFTPILHFVARHPTPATRRALDVLIQTAGVHRGGRVSSRDLRGSDVPMRLYTPEGLGGSAPLLVFLHGGGYVVGSLDSHRQACRFIADRAGCKVLAVGYRKAPEHRFPAALDDCVAAFRWAATHAAELGVDPARIAVGGDSAGGNAAIGVCLATASDPIRPAAAWLMYPVVDPYVGAWPSAKAFAAGPLLSLACVDDMLDTYLPDTASCRDPRVRVLEAAGLGELPPVYLATAGMDILRDQGEAFAERAGAAGAKVELRRFDRLPHAFINLLIDRRAAAATTECASALAGLLSAGTDPNSTGSSISPDN